jgi:hypothetical protein
MSDRDEDRDPTPEDGAGVIKKGFVALHAEPLPKPTFWPATLAFAVTFLLWGIVTTPMITAVGVALLALSLAGWIGDIRHETRSH